MATPPTAEIPPDTLDRFGRALWTRTIRELKAQSTWSPSDSPLLARYCTSVQVGRLARGRIAANAARIGDRAYVTEGSRGQLIQHPDVKTARDADRDASAYAAELLLSPKARAQHAVRTPPTGPSRLQAVLDRPPAS
jgi:P27 family predicted phage terminase small subunit